MKEERRDLVLDRLRELEGWAEYIAEALHLDQPDEPVRREMLEQALDGHTLRRVRELSLSLQDKLQVVRARFELSHPSEPPTT